jgi:hypothetical protein
VLVNKESLYPVHVKGTYDGHDRPLARRGAQMHELLCHRLRAALEKEIHGTWENQAKHLDA